MTHRRKLLHYPALYDHPGSDALFLAAMRETTAYHIAQNPAYAEIAEQAGFRLDSLATLDDLHRIPPLPTLFLKRHTMFSRPEGKMVVKATTSGTSGRKSTVGIDLNTGLLLSPWSGAASATISSPRSQRQTISSSATSPAATIKPA